MMMSLRLISTFAGVAFVVLCLSFASHAQSGSFIGASNHATSGGFVIEKSGGKYKLILKSNFKFDGAPDPTLGFGKNGKFVKSTQFSELRSNRGKQVYRLAASFKPGQYDALVLWCREFSVPLGVAKF